MFAIPFVGSALAWLFRAIVIKFVVLSAIIAAVAFLAPKAVTLVLGVTSTEHLDVIFGNLTPHMWYWLDLFRFDVGFAVIMGSLITRFLIRRLPVIG